MRTRVGLGQLVFGRPFAVEVMFDLHGLGSALLQALLEQQHARIVLMSTGVDG